MSAQEPPNLDSFRALHRRLASAGPHPERALLAAYVERLLDKDESLAIASHVSSCDECSAFANAYRAEEEAMTGVDSFTGESSRARVLVFPAFASLRGFQPVADTMRQAAGDRVPATTTEQLQFDRFRAIVSVAGGQVTVQVTENERPVEHAGIRLLVVRPTGVLVHATGATNDLGLAVMADLPAVEIQPGGHHMVLDVVLEGEEA